MVYHLSDVPWQLKAMHPYVPLQGNSMETGIELRGITPWIPCKIPGGVALPLYQAGYIEHPYYEMNSLKCEWMENKWWVYRARFSRPALKGSRYQLVFHGVDYQAMIYLNNEFLGEHEGMYDRFSYDITEAMEKSEELELRVLIKHAPDEMGQIGKTSETFTQKSRFNYKWDFGTRLVNLGIWKDIDIVAEEDCCLEDLSLSSDVTDGGEGEIALGGAVRCFMEANPGCTVRAECFLDGEKKAEAVLPVQNDRFAGALTIPNPALWYPNGQGEQPLYQVKITLLSGDRILDEREYRQGIRRLRYLQNEDAGEDALPYTFEVNGRRIYIRGVNMTPLDHIYGDIPPSQYRQTLLAAKNMNVNLIRVWGGGIIESELFYDLCDQYGLMVWQEFIQSSSGIDNIPSKRPEFLRLLEKTARCALCDRRNHTSLTVWSGGNELMDADGIPSTYEDENIAMLKKLTAELDPKRLFLPTSASGPTEWQLAEPGKSHDIHGDWQYRGNPRHYETYARADNLFHSEFGCDGMTNLSTIAKIFGENRRTPRNMDQDDVWRFHGDWWDTYPRDTGLYGPMENLTEFIKASQWTQAEGLRYILEANRRRQFHNSGSIIWQFNEPWPNVSCTCLYTYHGDPKMAYYWVKDAYAPFHVSLDYTRLDYQPGREVSGTVWLSADGMIPEGEASITCEAFTPEGTRLFGENKSCSVKPNGSVLCFPVRFAAPAQANQLFFVRLTACWQGYVSENTYFFSTQSDPVYAPARTLPPARLRAEYPEEGICRITNDGDAAALHVHLADETGEYHLLSDQNYFTLLPGESRTLSYTLTPKAPFGFGEYAAAPAGPRLEVHAFNETRS